MKIVVCVKQVPDTNEVRIDPVTHTMVRDGVPSILNPEDGNAMEEALRIKDRYPDTHVTALTMGPPQAQAMLRECLAMGADEAILLTDRAFAGADTWSTANAIASAIRAIGQVDLVLVGRQAIDGDTAQVGPQIAERLNIPQVTYVRRLVVEEDGSLTVERGLERGYEVIQVRTPVLLSAVKELNTPRYLSILGICKAYEKEITLWTIQDIDITPAETGLSASPTKVYRTFTPDTGREGVIWEEDAGRMAGRLISALSEKHVLSRGKE